MCAIVICLNDEVGLKDNAGLLDEASLMDRAGLMDKASFFFFFKTRVIFLLISCPLITVFVYVTRWE